MPTEYDDDGRMIYHSRRPPQPWSDDAASDECAQPRRRSRNRSLAIILIDVALILLIYAVISTFTRADAWRGVIAGVEVTLHVQPGEPGTDADIWQLRFTRRQPATVPPGTDIVAVQFSDGNGFNPEPILDVLPDAPGTQRIFEVAAPASIRMARARVTVGDTALDLRRRTR